MILKNSLAIPKLLYLLRTSECGENRLLRQFDDTLWTGLINILNVDLNDDQWLQASSPVGEVWEYGVLRCWHLQPFWHQLHPHSSSSNPYSPTAFGCKGTNPLRLVSHYGEIWPTRQNLLSIHNTSRNHEMDQL